MIVVLVFTYNCVKPDFQFIRRIDETTLRFATIRFK